jgi:hypothetical protein
MGWLSGNHLLGHRDPYQAAGVRGGGEGEGVVFCQGVAGQILDTVVTAPIVTV